MAALTALQALVDEQRRQHPELTGGGASRDGLQRSEKCQLPPLEREQRTVPIAGTVLMTSDGEVKKRADDDHGEAYEKLARLAEQMHVERPELTFAQCFEKIFTSPANREIAKAERIANRPVATGW